jgi:NADH:ubiquinone oxidoreductase subunit 3 (subunit A)
MVGPPFERSTDERHGAAMSPEKNPSNDQAAGQISSLGVLGARLTWLLFGPAALVLMIWAIASGGSGWITVLDAAFFAVLGLTVLGRWVEQRSGAATTLTGQPATLEQCKRYTVVLLIAAAIAWLAANVVGNVL